MKGKSEGQRPSENDVDTGCINDDVTTVLDRYDSNVATFTDTLCAPSVAEFLRA